MIRAVYLTNSDSMEFICNPFQFFPLCVDPVNFSSKTSFLEQNGTSSLLRGRPVIKSMSFTVKAIGQSSQIFLSWYLLTRNLAASSLRVPKLSIMGALRYDLILAAMTFLAFSLFAHSLNSTQYLGQLCSSSFTFLILSRRCYSTDIFFSSSIAFFLDFAASRDLALALSLMLPLIFSAMVEFGWLDLVGCQLILLARCWLCDSSATILNSNRCQSFSISFVFIAEEGNSHPITSLMR